LHQPTGEVFLADTAPITLEVGEQHVTLPIAARVVIGRLGHSPDADQPDVDLNQFSAREKGVSRRHCAITRKGKLVYLSDLGSSNGTRLNGKRLFGDQARLLRAGDALELGKLRLLVRF
jgi:pSer/pThr/pTyr-binding forkhead associated (FHA) protein